MNKKLLITLILSLQTLLNANNTITTGQRATSKIDRMSKETIADMYKIPQDPLYYANQLKKVSYRTQLQWDKEYNQKYFRPWTLNQIDEPLYEMQWPFRSVTQKVIYDSKANIIPSSTYTDWIKNANFDKLNSVRQRGITIRHVDVKALPTNRSFYRNPEISGEGFPFDYNQNSSYHINTPLYISHYSLDQKWVFVRGSTTYGWIETSAMAIVDDAFINKFKNGYYSIAVVDNLKLYSDKKYLTLVKLGTIFPTIEENNIKSYLFAKRETNGKAILQTANTTQEGIISKKPIAMTANNVARVAKQFYNEPYGWGGLLQTRDCSSFTKDYFAPFGIFLRRNSSKQAKDGEYCSIQGIPKSKKKEVIINNAKPFQSMLYVPGHIVLYIGQYQGEPVIMHTYWGARLQDGSKKVLARTVITTTEPGRELDEIKEQSKLAHTLRAIVTPGE